MHILVTNDDGIDSPGLWALARAMQHLGKVMVVAPDRQQSGVGTSVSLHHAMQIDEVEPPVPGALAYAVRGTPSDCVILAIRHLAQGRRYGLLVSGINLGANVGHDIPYSGTVMATLQGYLRRIPSMAVSLATFERDEVPDFTVGAMVAEFLARQMLAGEIPTDSIINANVPNIPLAEIKGVVTTRAAATAFLRASAVTSDGGLRYSLQARHRGHKLAGQAVDLPEPGTDIWAIHQGMVSITPVRIDVTDHGLIPKLEPHAAALQAELFRRRGGA